MQLFLFLSVTVRDFFPWLRTESTGYSKPNKGSERIAIDRQFLTWRSRCSSHTCRFRNPASSILRKRTGSAAEKIDDSLSTIPPTARSVLKLPSGVILRAIAVEIILACLLGRACKTLHFANPLSKGTFCATPFTSSIYFPLSVNWLPLYRGKYKALLGTAETTWKKCLWKSVYLTAIPSVVISLKHIFFTYSFTISFSFPQKCTLVRLFFCK